MTWKEFKEVIDANIEAKGAFAEDIEISYIDVNNIRLHEEPIKINVKYGLEIC